MAISEAQKVDYLIDCSRLQHDFTNMIKKEFGMKW